MATPAIARYDSERAFFDGRASRNKAKRISDGVIARYANPGSKFPLEMMFRLAGNLRGKTVLDVGCGEGLNSVVLGLLGARVTGIDISPGSIRLAQEMCAVNGVDAEFICSPLEEFTGLGRTYDVVWVDALLHHMLHDLPATLALLSSLVAPGGVILMKEPVNLCGPLRRARLVLGPAPDATPDERPLEAADIACIRGHFQDVQDHRFYLLGRLNRWVTNDAARRLLATLDAAMLSVPGVRNMASVAVLSATAR